MHELLQIFVLVYSLLSHSPLLLFFSTDSFSLLFHLLLFSFSFPFSSIFPLPYTQDGSFDLLCHEGNINLQLNKVGSKSTNSNKDSTSLIPSRAVAILGGIAATVDPEVSCRVECKSLLRDSEAEMGLGLGLGAGATGDGSSDAEPSIHVYDPFTATIVSDAFEPDSLASASFSTPSTTSTSTPSSPSAPSAPSAPSSSSLSSTKPTDLSSFAAGYLAGRLTGDSRMSSKKPVFHDNFSYKANSSGKINLTAAAMQSLLTHRVTTEGNEDESFTDSNGDINGDSNGDSNGDGSGSTSSSNSSSIGLKPVFDLTFVARTSVRVETLSWIEIIRRKVYA